MNDVCSITLLESCGNRIQAMLACIQKQNTCELCYTRNRDVAHRIHSLTPYPTSVTVCGDLACKEVIEVKRGHCRAGPSPSMTDAFIREGRDSRDMAHEAKAV